jgi:hypothetical protein
MSAPKRWLDEGGGATPNERDLLRSASSLDPPDGAQSEVWTALLAKLPPPGPAGGGGSTGSGASGGKAAVATKGAAAAKAASTASLAAGGGILKSALIGAGAAVALVTTYSVVTPSPTGPQAAPNPGPAEPAQIATASRPDSRPALTASPAPSTAELPSSAAPVTPTSAPSAERRADVRPPASASASAAPAASERETMLREESRQVAEARDALRRGDYAGALAQLEQIRARFPGGGLAQEREALAIEALHRSGRRADASARANAFLATYPSSPLAERVQAFAK